MGSSFEIDKQADQATHGREEQVFSDYLKSRGLKLTASRRHLLRRIFSMHDHFTAEQLLERLRTRKQKVSKATVYRTLNVLLDCGLLAAHDFGEGSLYYEHTFGHEHHDHFFCVHCKQIVEFRHDRIEELQQSVARDLGFTLLSHALKLYGLCPTCSEDEELVTTHRSRSRTIAT